MTVPIVLAEPHPAVRAALTALLLDDGRLHVVATPDLPGAVWAVARHRAPILIVARRLLERDSTGMRLPATLPAGTRTIVLCTEDHAAFARDALRAGAAAYVVKDRADHDLPPEIDALLDTKRVTATARLSA